MGRPATSLVIMLVDAIFFYFNAEAEVIMRSGCNLSERTAIIGAKFSLGEMKE